MKKTERNNMESKAPHTPSSATASVRRVSKGRRILISILSLLMVVGIGLGVGLGIANKNMGGVIYSIPLLTVREAAVLPSRARPIGKIMIKFTT